MADTADTPVPQGASPSIIQRATAAVTTVGGTGVAMGSGFAISATLGWLFDCHDAAVAAHSDHFLLIVHPTKEVIEQMSAGIALASHGLKRGISSLRGRSKTRRATDAAAS